jgi:predicted membrane-bound mannosyltransferase
MNENERQLLVGLRALAAMEPRQASPRVEQTLRATFRARAERRRRAVWGSAAAAFVAIAAAIMVLFFVPLPWHRNQAVPRVASELPSDASNVPGVQYAVVRTDDLAASFYPLPEADELPPLETSLVVRVQLPVSSLELMGFPVSEEAGTEAVQAEVLLGQDGLARGVRLIQ